MQLITDTRRTEPQADKYFFLGGGGPQSLFCPQVRLPYHVKFLILLCLLLWQYIFHSCIRHKSHLVCTHGVMPVEGYLLFMNHCLIVSK